jgi:carbon-monoxide dehydrogenase medium subunit
MYDFNYHRPRDLADAVRLRSAAEDGVFLAGGMTLIPTLRLRLASPSDVIDISGVDGLSDLEASAESVRVGALVRHATVAVSADVKKRIPALAALADGIGDAQVRNRGTLGGSIANNDPAADYPAAILALGATVMTNKREIAADDYFTGLFDTALEADEIVTAARFPVAEAAAYAKFPNPASRYALVGVFVARIGGAVRVAVTGAGDQGVFRAPEMEKALAGNFAPDALNSVTVAADGLNSDLHAGAEYRAHLIGVMAKRAVAACA